jgi:hypothetical protein
MSLPDAIPDFIFADHALFEMARRGVSEAEVSRVLSAPERSAFVRAGRAVYQARFTRGTPKKTYLLRVFVDVDRHPPEVVTAYWTSKIEKYWR